MMIEITDLSVEFSGSVKAIDNLTLVVPEGKNTIVIGESGSGKSVMLAAMLQILPPSAKISGSVRLNGLELLTMSEKQMRSLRGDALSYIPQGSGSSMNPLLTVGYQVAEPLIEKKGVPKKPALISAVEWMKKLHIGNEEKIASAYPHTLSGGMRQRALISMGAISGSPILLADEPTKGLDGERIEMVTDLFLTLKDRTILCVSHNLNFAEAIADYVCVMYSSQKVEYCSSKEFFAGPLHPYSRMTLEAMPENGLKVNMGFAPTHADFDTIGCHFYSRCPHKSERCQSAPPMVEKDGRKVRCWLYAD